MQLENTGCLEQSYYTTPGHSVFVLPSNCFKSSLLSSKISFPAFLLPVSNGCIFYTTEKTETIKPFICPHPSQSSNSCLSFKAQIRHYPPPLNNDYLLTLNVILKFLLPSPLTATLFLLFVLKTLTLLFKLPPLLPIF